MKTCIVREYTAKNFKAPQDLSAEGLLGPNSNTFLFEAKMHPPSSTHGNKVSMAYKTVFTEYYILNGMELIGTVGGTLGLMIGFSFMGSIISITDWIITLYCKIKISKKEAFTKRDQRHERTKVAPRRASV